MTDQPTTENTSTGAFLHPRYWATWAGIGALRLLSWLPIRILFGIGKVLGKGLHLILPGRRRIATVNIERCFPTFSSREVATIVRESFEVIATVAITTGISWWASRNRISHLVHLHDVHHFTDALSEGRSVILLAPHFSAAATISSYLGTIGPSVSIYQRINNRLLDILMLKGRQRFGIRLFERKSSMREVIRALKNGEFLYYLPDQDPGPRRAVFAPFFDIPTASWPVLGRITSMTNAVVIPCFCSLNRDRGGYDITFDTPLDNFPGDNPVADATRMNQVIESAIRAMPSQYFWVHKRFKTRPPGEDDFYRRMTP
jgi:KDO2-lipid IV(A) lauroyltransferase|tara:strand:- start:54 stop:1001 length:948 start_codon:yes stop_codon:yes gene_type:complete